MRAVFGTNFDGLPARAAANFKIAPIEVGIDTVNRADRRPQRSELLCVSMHGDYRYDRLKNTPAELQKQEEALRSALIEHLRGTLLVVAGYSGRDESVMTALRDAYAHPGSGTLYWCGYGDGPMPAHVAELIAHARSKGRQAYYVPSLGFDDLMARLGLHCLEGDARAAALRAIEELTPADRLARAAWKVPTCRASTLIKSNAFAIECPSEVLRFDLNTWPSGKVWASLRDITGGRSIVAVPFKGKIYAFGTIDDIKAAFGDNIKGPIERTPLGPTDLRFEDGAITALMRQTLTRAMAEDSPDVRTDGRHELWHTKPRSDQRGCKPGFKTYDSVQLYLRRIGGAQYLVLKPSIKVLASNGEDAPHEIAKSVKVAILGYQHNKPFNQAVMKWRETLLGNEAEATFEFPANCGSSFRFKVRRSPVFGEIGLAAGLTLNVSDKLRPLIKYSGIELGEPDLVFSNRAGTGLIQSPHPVRGLLDNRPYDFPLTVRGIATNLRVGVICPAAEAQTLRRYLQCANSKLSPAARERDYLVDYPGFQSAYGISLDLPDPGSAGWYVCPEPRGSDPHSNALAIAAHINHGIEALQSSFAPHVVIVFYPDRWAAFKRYRTEAERFDVHDFVKAYAVQRGVSTQFLNEDTLASGQQARVWWWLSLALYAKAMRTPWVLGNLAADTAFVGLGFSIDHAAEKGRQVVLGCSHIYSGRGEGLQYRLSKIE
ncbi:MAG: SIR2 family protein, partial [Myxococcota bacterium]